MYFPIILPTICVGINRLGVRMLDGMLRFILIVIGVVLIACVFPTLIVFFVQVLITVCIFLCILHIIGLFCKGDRDER